MKKLLLAGLRDDRWYGRGWSHQQREKEDFPESERSLMKTRKKTGPRTLLEELQPGHEEGMKELHFGPHVGCDRRGSLRAMRGDGLGYDRKSLVSRAGCQTMPKARDMSRDMALISCPALSTSIHCWESRSSISRVE